MQAVMETPWGNLLLQEENGAITACAITACAATAEAPIPPLSPLLQEAVRQIEEYARGERREFTLPLWLEGTPFMESVWRELQKIPYGQVKTYGEIARLVHNPKAARAVGGACHRNPLLLLVPCHRVVGESGLCGFGAGLPMKEALLRLENARFK